MPWLLFLSVFLFYFPPIYTKNKVADTMPCPPKTNESELNSFLWVIKRNPPSYFFGTIHVPYTRVWDFVPENTKKAFNQAENVFLELDLTDPYTISALSKCQLLPHGENLSNVLPQNLYNRLKRHLEYVRDALPEWMTADQKGRGLYPEYLFNAIAGNWERKRPVWVMLMVNSLTEGDIKSRGIPVLDLYLAQMSEQQGKVTGAVERVDEQCVPLNELNFSQRQTMPDIITIHSQNVRSTKPSALLKEYLTHCQKQFSEILQEYQERCQHSTPFCD